MKLIIGLGNPGPDYANHKHNLGFWVVEVLAKENKWKWEKSSILRGTMRAIEAWGELENENVWLAKPLTWMNLSGEAVQALLKAKQILPQDLIVIHDDIDLGLGKIRWVFGSGHGGHNGVRSIIELIGTKDFYRVRLGVGRPLEHLDAAEYVLQPFVGEDLRVAEEMAAKGAQSVADFLKHGLPWVQNRYH